MAERRGELMTAINFLDLMEKLKGKRIKHHKRIEHRAVNPEYKVGDCGSFPNCYYCEVPEEIRQKTIMQTYNGDTCGLYEDYMDERDSFGRPFTIEELTLKCRDSFLGKYPDIQDFDKTIEEILIDIDLDDLGMVCKGEDGLFRLV